MHSRDTQYLKFRNDVYKTPFRKFGHIIRLRRLAETCDFKNVHDEMIRNRLVLGCKDKGRASQIVQTKGMHINECIESTANQWTDIKQITIDQ